MGYILNRREYLGHTVLGKTTRDNFKTKRKRIANEDELLVFYNTHEAIIDQETYDKAQRMRKRVSPRRNSEKPAHRLSGLLYCADCGSRLAYINSKPKDGKIYDSNQAFRCSRYHNKYHSCTGHYIKASTIEMLIYQATKRVSQYVLKDEKEFVEQLKAQYELQCEKDNTDDKKELLEAKRRMMDLDDLIKGLYENFTLGRLPERQFNRLMTEYDTEQSSLEQRISELETATERISTKAVQIDKFVRLVKKYRDFEELTTPMLNDFIEKVVIHEAEGGRTKDRTQQVDIYFNFIGNFVLPLSEDEVEALQSEEARRAEEIAERKRKSSKKSTQKRNHKRAEIKAKAEAGDSEAMAEYKAILEKGRQNNRKRSEKMRELRMSDPEYRAKMEEKERLALEREKKRQERATKKKKIALAELKEQAEKGNQEAVRELEESRAIARERSRKSAEKRKQRAENDPEYAKYLEERNAEYNRRHTARRKEQMEALRARAEAGDQEAKSQLAERKQYQVRATVKSYRKMREDALKSGLMNTKVLGVNIQTLRYQVPGGMLSNLVSQLKEMGQEDKYEQVLEEVPRVRKDFGEPPLVTPSSQIVGTQAVLNVVSGERYKMVTKESKKLLSGQFGQTVKPFNPEVQKKCIGDEKPITCRPADLIKPQLADIEKEMAQYKQQDEDVLSYALFPQVATEFFKYREAQQNKVDASAADTETKAYPV